MTHLCSAELAVHPVGALNFSGTSVLQLAVASVRTVTGSGSGSQSVLPLVRVATGQRDLSARTNQWRDSARACAGGATLSQNLAEGRGAARDGGGPARGVPGAGRALQPSRRPRPTNIKIQRSARVLLRCPGARAFPWPRGLQRCTFCCSEDSSLCAARDICCSCCKQRRRLIGTLSISANASSVRQRRRGSDPVPAWALAMARTTARHAATSAGARSRRCHRPACGSASVSTSHVISPARPASHPPAPSSHVARTATRALRAQLVTSSSGTPPVAARTAASPGSGDPARAAGGCGGGPSRY